MRDPQDWREEARRKLLNSRLSDVEREEISRELAGYLEDLCRRRNRRRTGRFRRRTN